MVEREVVIEEVQKDGKKSLGLLAQRECEKLENARLMSMK